MKNILNCITIGDIDGVGIELISKIWKNHRKKTGPFFLLGNYNLINNKLKKYKYPYYLKKIINPIDTHKYFYDSLPVLHLQSKNKNLNTLDSLKKSYKLAVSKKISGIITLPINKKKISLIDYNFSGHTEFFEDLDNSISNMIFYSKKIIVSPLTTHIPLFKINNYITKEFLEKKILSLIKSLKNDFNIKKIKLAITGLNPHAGENGKIGNEENKIIMPIIKKLKRMGLNITGPLSADTVFLEKNIKNFDCILTMFHDQALIPFKILSFNQGVNFTSGLSFIRTSPCHGVAYDIVGKNIANEKSLYNAIILANKIFINRNNDKKIFRAKLFNRS